MKKLSIMCGIQASGKRTEAKKLQTRLLKQNKTVKYVSRDNIRFSIINDKDEYFAKETEVYDKFIDEINNGLLKYDYTIADATHLNHHSREKLLSRIKYPCMIVGYNVLTTLNTCLERNNKREGRYKVPEKTIKDMYNKFEKIGDNQEENKIFSHIFIKEENKELRLDEQE